MLEMGAKARFWSESEREKEAFLGPKFGVFVARVGVGREVWGGIIFG